MTLNELIKTRRSIRKYSDKPVDRDILYQVLEAGRLAPSAKNEQNWHFTVIENPELRHKMLPACYDQPMVEQAPLDLVIWSDYDRDMACGQSATSLNCSIALSFMLLKATELGLGTCWLGRFDADAVKQVLSLPQDATVVAVTPLGYPAEEVPARSRKSIDELVTIL